MEYFIMSIDTYADVSEKSRRVQYWATKMFSYHRILGNDGLHRLVAFIKEKIESYNRDYPKNPYTIKLNHLKLNGYIECYVKKKEYIKIFIINYHQVRGSIY